MIRTDVVLLKPTQEQEKKLFYLAEQSAQLWNGANYQRRQAFFSHKKMPSYAEQCNIFKTSEHFKSIGTAKGQAILKKLAESWSAFWELKRLQKQGILPNHIQKVSPPRYLKNRKTAKIEAKMFCVRSDSYRVKNGYISIAKNLKIEYASDRIRDGKHGRLDVIYDDMSNRWYAHIPVKLVPEQADKTAVKYGSIDLGICNIATLYVPDSKPIVYSGRAVLSDWIYHTKKIAKLQSQLKQNQYTSRQIQGLFRIRQRRFRHAVNAMLCDLFRRARECQVTDLTVGHLKGIRDNKNFGNRTNQKLHNFWNHAYIIQRIKEIGEEFGIKIHMVSERDTSKTCALCAESHNGRIHRGLHFCKNKNIVTNADVNGAYNMYKVAVYGSFNASSGSGALASPLMLRWEYHRWH